MLAVFAVPTGLLLSPGCGVAHDACDVICECTHCNDRTEDECLISAQRQLDVAVEYDCEAEALDYADCVINKGECDDTSFTIDDCLEEFADANECIADNSDIRGPIVGEGEGEGEGEGPPQPICGNGVVEPPEECDDGNFDPADGCEPDCTITPQG